MNDVIAQTTGKEDAMPKVHELPKEGFIENIDAIRRRASRPSTTCGSRSA